MQKLSELKTEQFCAFGPFMKRALEIAASGGEVDMTQTKMVYGRIYFLKYRELESDLVQPTNDSAPQDNLVGNTANSVKPAVADYDAMSDEQLRELAKESKVQGWANAKRETLIKKLQANA